MISGTPGSFCLLFIRFKGQVCFRYETEGVVSAAQMQFSGFINLSFPIEEDTVSERIHIRERQVGFGIGRDCAGKRQTVSNFSTDRWMSPAYVNSRHSTKRISFGSLGAMVNFRNPGVVGTMPQSV